MDDNSDNSFNGKRRLSNSSTVNNISTMDENPISSTRKRRLSNSSSSGTPADDSENAPQRKRRVAFDPLNRGPGKTSIRRPRHQAFQQSRSRAPSPVASPNAPNRHLSNSTTQGPRPVFGFSSQQQGLNLSSIFSQPRNPSLQLPFPQPLAASEGTPSPTESPFSETPNPTISTTQTQILQPAASNPPVLPRANSSSDEHQPKSTSAPTFPGLDQSYVWNFIRKTPLRGGVPIRSVAAWTRQITKDTIFAEENPSRMSYRCITNAIATQIANIHGEDRDTFTSWLEEACQGTMVYHFSRDYRIVEDFDSGERGQNEVLWLKLRVFRLWGHDQRCKEAEMLLRGWGKGAVKVVQQVVKINVFVKLRIDNTWCVECEEIVARLIDADRFSAESRWQVERYLEFCDSKAKGDVALAYFESVSVKEDGGVVDVAVVRLEDTASGQSNLKWREFQTLTTALPKFQQRSKLRVKDLGNELWDAEKSIQALSRLRKEDMVEALLYFEELMATAQNPTRRIVPTTNNQIPPSGGMYFMMFGMVISALHESVMKSGGPRKLLSTIAFEMVPASGKYREVDFLSDDLYTIRSSLTWHYFHRSYRFETSWNESTGPRNRNQISGLNQFLREEMGSSELIEALAEYCTKAQDWDVRSRMDRIVRDIRVISYPHTPSDFFLIESVVGMENHRQDGAFYSEMVIIPNSPARYGDFRHLGRESGWAIREDLASEDLKRGFTVKILEDWSSDSSQEIMSTRQIITNLGRMKWKWSNRLLRFMSGYNGRILDNEKTLCFVEQHPRSKTVFAQFRNLSNIASSETNQKIHILPFSGESDIPGCSLRERQREAWSKCLYVKWDAEAEREIPRTDWFRWFSEYWRLGFYEENQIAEPEGPGTEEWFKWFSEMSTKCLPDCTRTRARSMWQAVKTFPPGGASDPGKPCGQAPRTEFVGGGFELKDCLVVGINYYPEEESNEGVATGRA